MRALASAAVLVVSALGTTACAGGNSESTYGSLSRPLQNFIHATIQTGPSTGPVNEVDVFGPASRGTLVTASSGDWVAETPSELKKRFYLIVLHGHFVCDSCSVPPGAKAPEGTIETSVWSPGSGSLDFGIGGGVPAAVFQLPWVGSITLS